MSFPRDTNTVLAVSLLCSRETPSEVKTNEMIEILNANRPGIGGPPPFSFDATIIKLIWEYLQTNHHDWFEFVQSWGPNNPRVGKAIGHLRRGHLAVAVPSKEETSFEELFSMWRILASPSGIVSENVEGGVRFRGNEDMFEGKLVTLPEIEFFDSDVEPGDVQKYVPAAPRVPREQPSALISNLHPAGEDGKMACPYDTNSIVAVSLVRNRFPTDEAVAILNKNVSRAGCGTFKFTADIIETIWQSTEISHPQWRDFVRGWSDDDPEINRAISRLQDGIIKGLIQRGEEVTFESLKRTWETFMSLDQLIIKPEDINVLDKEFFGMDKEYEAKKHEFSQESASAKSVPPGSLDGGSSREHSHVKEADAPKAQDPSPTHYYPSLFRDADECPAVVANHAWRDVEKQGCKGESFSKQCCRNCGLFANETGGIWSWNWEDFEGGRRHYFHETKVRDKNGEYLKRVRCLKCGINADEVDEVAEASPSEPEHEAMNFILEEVSWDHDHSC